MGIVGDHGKSTVKRVARGREASRSDLLPAKWTAHQMASQRRGDVSELEIGARAQMRRRARLAIFNGTFYDPCMIASMAAASEPLPLNRDILRWARERSRLDHAQVAQSIKVAPEKIVEWEEGRSDPTVRQARMLAATYNRPFLEFFSPAVPVLAPLQLVPDYRLQNREPTELEIAALEGVQSWAETQRLNALDLFEMLGEAVPRLPADAHATVDDDPEEIAAFARRALRFSIDDQLSIKAKDRGRLPTKLRRKLEALGVLVLKQSDLSKSWTRGICLFHQTLPVIVMGNEAPGGQAFTLAHEFGHILLRQSAISGAPILSYKHGSFRRRVEGWCNAFAAAFLMPAAALRSNPFAPTECVDEIADISLNALANSFSVSRHAMLIRLVSLGLVNARYYWRVKRRKFLLEEAAFAGRGRSTYYGSRYRGALGDLYTGLVLEALGTGQLGYHSASEFMGIKNARHLHDIKEHFGA